MEKIQSLLKNGKIYLLNLLKVVEINPKPGAAGSIPGLGTRSCMLHSGVKG